MGHGINEVHLNEGIEEVDGPGSLGIAAWNREEDTAPDMGTLNAQSERTKMNTENVTNSLEEYDMRHAPNFLQS